MNKSEGSMPTSEGDTFLGESLRNNHRTGSSGLNLSREGLLLGMRARGYRDS
jgi:hypothetical protein